MKALRIHVERIVRPIRASVRRKNRMRNELLAHLTAAFEEERAHAGSDENAFARAMERLGDPNVLRDDLQSAIPWYERLAHIRIPLRMQIFDYERRTTYGWRASARFATEIVLCLFIGSPILVSYGCIITFAYGLDNPGLVDFGSKLLTIAGLVACLWVSLFVAFWLFDLVGARKRVAPWSETPALFKACLTTLLWMFAIGLFLTMAPPLSEAVQPQGQPDNVGNILINALFVIPYGGWIILVFLVSSICFMAAAMNFERRQYEKWGSLEIDTE